MSEPIVALVIVSHSEKIAEGVVELARQMAPSTTMLSAGGIEDGGIGTSFEKVSAALLGAAAGHSGVAVICDLGSAILTTETALEFLDDEVQAKVAIADAPIVEGAVAAAVAAESGADLVAVLAAALSANGAQIDSVPAGVDADPSAAASSSSTATLVNRDGLHARPAAEFVKLAMTFDAAVKVNDVDAKSLLRIMSLGLAAGSTVSISATGEQATEAVEALTALIESGFGEPRV